MIDYNLPTGYDMYNPFGNEQWVIDLKNGLSFYGSLKEVVFYMTEKLGFDKNVILDATNEMVDNGHNAIHFGTFRTILFTFNKEINFSEAS